MFVSSSESKMFLCFVFVGCYNEVLSANQEPLYMLILIINDSNFTLCVCLRVCWAAFHSDIELLIIFFWDFWLDFFFERKWRLSKHFSVLFIETISLMWRSQSQRSVRGQSEVRGQSVQSTSESNTSDFNEHLQPVDVSQSELLHFLFQAPSEHPGPTSRGMVKPGVSFREGGA